MKRKTFDATVEDVTQKSEKLNINPSTYAPKYTVEVQSAEPKISRRFVALLCVICAVVGGIFGGMTSARISKNNTRDLLDSFASETRNYLETLPTNTVNSLSPLISELDSAANLDDSTTIVSSDNTTIVQADTSTEIPATNSTATEPMAVTQAENTTIRSGPAGNISGNGNAAYSAKDVYADNIDAVVQISCTTDVIAGLFGGVQQATVNASGFIITEDGYVLTNYHVIENAYDFTVVTSDTTKYDAQLVGFDQQEDLAVLKIEAKDLQAVDLGTSMSLYVGDEILIIGNPLGNLDGTLTRGVISAKDRKIENGDYIIDMIQTDAAVNIGNSGGPVFNSDGDVVGIATAKYASSSIEGLSFFIPVDDIVDSITDIIAFGYVKNRPSLGLSIIKITSNMANRYGLVEGAYVVAGDAAACGAQAGIVENDIIVAIDAYSVKSVKDMKNALTNFKSGDTVVVRFYRGGTYFDASVTLDEFIPRDARTKYTNAYDV
ncbi:MAG TPA: trypsin-like serine protease [Clostridiales bacterium]|nr:trypsin-like serine protease [Clostridiales bacterium]